jgi:2-C-methyl-D-erythritol 4-phosphate cytidylyltransferase / 2-C-methyl-D-erythritol 2,4-cyclodiphosphate synthase
MEKSEMTVALIMAAGKGTRIGGDLPKQFSQLGAKSVVAHSVDTFMNHPLIDEVYIVIGDGQDGFLAEALGDRSIAGVVSGGAERHNSVYAGLEAIGSAKRVLIHDAARPLLPSAVIDRLLDAVESSPGAVPALSIVDTLARVGNGLGETVDRDTLMRVQTPQAFAFDAIMTAHRAWTGDAATDDAQMARAAGFAVAIVEGDSMLDKITHPADFAAAEAKLGGQWVSRTGMGYDVHRLVAGKELWLCGLLIPHDSGLSGHSDADVALHALTDALLGAIAEGDIGDHFPPSDPQWRGAASSIFIQHAAKMVAARGSRISSVDLTIICEEPRIGPHRAAMRARIADLLQLDVNRISVKATTTEGLGFTGRGEGIAAQAIVTISEREF